MAKKKTEVKEEFQYKGIYMIQGKEYKIKPVSMKTRKDSTDFIFKLDKHLIDLVGYSLFSLLDANQDAVSQIKLGIAFSRYFYDSDNVKEILELALEGDISPINIYPTTDETIDELNKVCIQLTQDFFSYFKEDKSKLK